MDFTTIDRERSFFSKSVLQLFDNTRHQHGYLPVLLSLVINVPQDVALLPVDHFVGNTPPVVRIDHEIPFL
jgi:hypothetical protein